MDALPPILSVIIPARNEEDCVGECLRSLVAQEEDGWRLGSEWEIIVVNDASSDRTREIAAGFAGVTVMDAPRLERGWTGKANACWAGSRVARGKWLLFTDADTVHGSPHATAGITADVTGTPNTLRLAMIEAERHEAGMLSYSPRQIVRGLAQRALMPLVFSDLAVTYSPAKVNDPARRVAAANGQFLLVRRDAYDKIGGHAAVKGSMLEDVELAFAGEAAESWDCVFGMRRRRWRRGCIAALARWWRGGRRIWRCCLGMLRCWRGCGCWSWRCWWGCRRWFGFSGGWGRRVTERAWEF